MNNISPFVKGGPLTSRNSAIYIERKADQEAAHRLQKMEYIALIEPHQQGKTSLIAHLMQRLNQDQNYYWVYEDLSVLSESGQARDWNVLLKRKIWEQIKEKCTHFTNLPDLSFRTLVWEDFFRVLSKMAEETNTHLVIAFDEVAAIPSAHARGFFSTMRALINNRLSSSCYYFLTFIISCAYDPNLLIKDSPISNAMNVFNRVKIPDFTLNEVQELVTHLPSLEPKDERFIAGWIQEWVNGHPFMSQYICDVLFTKRLQATSSSVDKAVQYFRKHDSQHLPNIRKKLDANPKLKRHLREIHKGKRENLALYSKAAALELIGLIKADENNLCMIRNRLYGQFVDEILYENLDLKELHEYLIKHFSSNEMKTLCMWELKVDYDDLDGQNRKVKARELIAYCVRHGLLEKLIKACKKARPNVLWLF